MDKMIKKLCFKIRHGKVTSQTMATERGVISEVAFSGRSGKRVGYWTHGSFDPGYPYQGQDVDFDLRGKFDGKKK